jgi:peptidoglycan/LPS O-acetylase OafA/YrhL
VTQRLAELLREQDPTVEAATIDTASSSIVFGLLGGAVLATVLVLLTLRRFSRRRRFSRALMVPVWLVVLAVAALAGLVVPTTGWQGWLLLGSMAASVVFVMVGCLAALGPGVSEWLRESRRGHPPGS